MLSLYNFFNDTLMFFYFFVIVDSYHEKIACIAMQRIRIFLFLNLLHRSLRSLIEGIVTRDIRRYIGSKSHR